ncbi:2Fe-2S iron-sulfur cluster binding domain-containing protein [Nocardia abscessus]|uniref:2Fe-2S iron-sulfur cluster binding domain-containing protein n=1 Tax=Nocardia abscessus TaxID=120957 RepID=A0ABS0CEY2_9NOCA|nr:2Fe-2S iron-sulfur cluster binding domain-containing protein [Nocardia abscessus]
MRSGPNSRVDPAMNRRRGAALPYSCLDGSCGTCSATVESGPAERVLLRSMRWAMVVVMTAGSATRRTQNGYPAAR